MPSAKLLAMVLVWSALVASSVLGGQTRPADTLEAARTCLLVRAPREPADSFARRCAEEFIARNGYTSSPPTADTSLWAPESIEFASSWAEALQQRHNTLFPRAESAGCEAGGCAATFRYPSDTSACYMRIVTMSSSFKGMRMQHQLVQLAPQFPRARACAHQKP